MRARLVAVLVVTACAPQTVPEPPAAPALFTAGQPAVTFAKPANWPATVRTKSGSQFVLVEASPYERLVISALPDGHAPLPAIEARVAEEVATRFPRTVTAASQPANVAGRPALRTALTLDGGQQGVRYVVTGGWLVEYETRPAHAAMVTPPFEQIVATLTLP